MYEKYTPGSRNLETPRLFPTPDPRLSTRLEHCQCSQKISVDYTLSCPNGGYTIMRHNYVRDLEGELMREVCRDVKIEPELLPVGEQEMGVTYQKKLD